MIIKTGESQVKDTHGTVYTTHTSANALRVVLGARQKQQLQSQCKPMLNSGGVYLITNSVVYSDSQPITCTIGPARCNTTPYISCYGGLL